MLTSFPCVARHHYRILDICERLVISGKVEYAEPDHNGILLKPLHHQTGYTLNNGIILLSIYPMPGRYYMILMPTKFSWSQYHHCVVRFRYRCASILCRQSFRWYTQSVPVIWFLAAWYPITTMPLPIRLGTYEPVPQEQLPAKPTIPSSVAGWMMGTAGIAGNCKIDRCAQAVLNQRYSDAYMDRRFWSAHSVTAGFPTPY